jgi:hypothetical protein
LYKLTKIVKYDELIYNYENITNEINKIILSVQTDEITAGGKYLVSIPFFIYTSLSSVNIDNKYTLISSTAADGIYRIDTIVGTTLNTQEFMKLYPTVHASFNQILKLAKVTIYPYNLISPTRKILVKFATPPSGDLFEKCKSIMFVEQATNFIFYYNKVISVKKLEDGMYDYEYELPNFRDDELVVNVRSDTCYALDSYVEAKFTGYNFETIKKYLPTVNYRQLTLQYNSKFNNSYFTAKTTGGNNGNNGNMQLYTKISGITIVSGNELNFSGFDINSYRSLMILDANNIVKYFENINTVNTVSNTKPFKYEITLNYEILASRIELNMYKCVLFSFYVPNNIIKIIKDNNYWLEDVNDCQIIKKLIKNEKIVIEGNEYKTQLAIPLNYFINNQAQDNNFTTQLSGENMFGRDPLKMFIQEQNDLIKKLNLPKLSTIALKIDGSYMEDFDIQNYKYEKLIEEHIQDLTDLP